MKVNYRLFKVLRASVFFLTLLALVARLFGKAEQTVDIFLEYRFPYILTAPYFVRLHETWATPDRDSKSGGLGDILPH